MAGRIKVSIEMAWGKDNGGWNGKTSYITEHKLKNSECNRPGVAVLCDFLRQSYFRDA